jgi:hypothetical protein
MASGKQTSFQFGEVSPSLRYRSNEVSYAQGLSKLKNMYVRKEGGVSNRPGLEYVDLAVSQLGIPSVGQDPGIKGFVYWNPVTKNWDTIEYAQSDDAPTRYSFYLNGGLLTSLFFIPSPGPIEIKFTPLKDQLLISPSIGGEFGFPPFPKLTYTLGYEDGLLTGGVFGTQTFTKSFPVGTSASSGYFGKAPFLPVSYIIVAIYKDGTESVLFNVESGVITNPDTAPATIVHPHADMMSRITITLGAAMPDVKMFNLYRAAGRGGLASAFYKLAGQCRYDGTTLSLPFEDYGADNPSLTPSIDTKSVYLVNLTGINAAAYYQQRLILAMEPGTGIGGNFVPESFKTGDLLASKLGAPEQIIPPIIYSNTGAFQFSVPITDGTPVVALLAMERLIVFTTRGVYAVRGGEQGVFTPTEVNPLMISETGCSLTVEPKMSGRRGYFLNAGHTKLMGIVFGLDGNLDVFEASIFSDHFLHEDIVMLEVVRGTEDTVYLLRRDGKLARITCAEDGFHGFALMETDGYIESIYRGREKRPYVPNLSAGADIYHDVLMCYVIRNGNRMLERMNIREDKFPEAEFFADCYGSFGYRLSLNGTLGYAKKAVGSATPPYLGPTILNIGDNTTSNWEAGETIKVYANSGPVLPSEVIHFFYEDSEGNLQTLRFIADDQAGGVASSYMTFTHEWTGHFTSDVPGLLRDVVSQNISALNKAKRHTRWLPTYNQLPAFGDEIEGVTRAAFEVFEALEAGEFPVSIAADGGVISSPLNPNKETIYLVRNASTGLSSIDMGDYYSFGYVGLPYESQMDTMDIEASNERTLSDANKVINAVGVGFMETRGGFFGLPEKELSDMEEISIREDGDLADPTKNFNRHKVITFPSEWNEAGRVSIKNVDPVPMTVLSVYPKGISGD